MIYIVDIDNTICRTLWGDYPRATPYPERIEKINQLYRDGHTIIYWTARGAISNTDWTSLTHEQLNRWGCLYHEVRMGKPAYDIWIDDKAINSLEYFKWQQYILEL